MAAIDDLRAYVTDQHAAWVREIEQMHALLTEGFENVRSLLGQVQQTSVVIPSLQAVELLQSDAQVRYTALLEQIQAELPAFPEPQGEDVSHGGVSSHPAA